MVAHLKREGQKLENRIWGDGILRTSWETLGTEISQEVNQMRGEKRKCLLDGGEKDLFEREIFFYSTKTCWGEIDATWGRL